MIKKNYLNYNIIFNLKRIRINKDYIYNSMNNNFEICPFYSIAIYKYFLNDKYQNEINDNYFIRKKEKIIKMTENEIDNYDDSNESNTKREIFYKCYTSDDNSLIFFFFYDDKKILKYLIII